jgi:hypothetical protein
MSADRRSSIAERPPKVSNQSPGVCHGALTPDQIGNDNQICRREIV